MRINHITPRNYNVIVTYNGSDSYYTDLGKSWKPGQEDYECGPLPNAPMSARHTLLAERLRKGRHVTDGEKMSRIVREKETLCPKHQSSLTGRLLGIEIEYYPKTGDGVRNTRLTKIAGDGSLDNGGVEIRRLTWASNSGRLEGLLKLKITGTVNKRCGLHVHVDARHLGTAGKLTPEQTYKRLVELYPMLKKLVPKSRHRNSYCRWTSNHGSGNRYSAINFCSFESHGTIEFRCQGGSINLIKIESWALLCQYLVNFCSTPEYVIPKTWGEFIAVLPEPLRSWCILRKEKLYGQCPLMNERTMSATLD